MTVSDTDEEDRSDMARLADGGDAALDGLMARHAEKLHHYLLRLLQNEAEAGDLAREAFVRVYQNRTRFDPAHKFSTWLYTIATNLARDVQRYRSRHPQVSLDREHPQSGKDFRDLLPETRPGPGESLELTERAGAVRQAIAALPEELRAPLILATYQELSHAEIARVLDCSAKAVEMKLYRARHELRGRLERMLSAA